MNTALVGFIAGLAPETALFEVGASMRDLREFCRRTGALFGKWQSGTSALCGGQPKRAVFALAYTCTILLRPGLSAADGVTNVLVSQRTSTNLVDLRYDLATVNPNGLTVAVAVSTNGGATYDLPATHFSGDVGTGITAGTNKWIVWEAATDWPGHLSTNVFFRLTASDLPMGMVLVSAGYFAMGDPLGDGTAEERPLHTNYVSAFYMDQYAVTKGLWDDVYQWATNHGYGFEYGALGKATDHPAQDLTWYDCAKWCNARSEKAGKTPAYYTDTAQTTVYRSGQTDLLNAWVKWSAGYRLPTEAEWEKAARGGASGQRFPWGNVISESLANYYGNTGGYTYDLGPTGPNAIFATGATPYTSPVGYFAANTYGLYDMAGNAWQWCWDRYAFYSSATQTDPHGPDAGTYRAFRGGGWANVANMCRSSYRGRYYPYIRNYYHYGFRTVLSTSP